MITMIIMIITMMITIMRTMITGMIRGRPKNKFGQKSELSDSAEPPPLPRVKSDTLFKNIFIAFFNSTAFVCYLEINLFFFPPKNQKKNLENFRAPSLLEATRNL